MGSALGIALHIAKHRRSGGFIRGIRLLRQMRIQGGAIAEMIGDCILL